MSTKIPQVIISITIQKVVHCILILFFSIKGTKTNSTRKSTLRRTCRATFTFSVTFFNQMINVRIGSHWWYLSQQMNNNRFSASHAYLVPPFQLSTAKQEKPSPRLYWMRDWWLMQMKINLFSFLTLLLLFLDHEVMQQHSFYLLVEQL